MIRIQTFGGLSVRGDDGRPLSGSAAQPRRMAVLAVLACAGDRGVTRDRLVAMLWPDAEEERARNNLAQALYALRRDLGGDDTIVGTKELRLDADRVASDVADFRAALTRGDDARAAELYAGPFLDGFHVPGAAELERWIEDSRRSLAHDHARVLESLARAAAAAGDAATAVQWWRRLAAADPLNARVAVGLMEALAASGDRAGALHHARIYEALLEQELDLPPDREVVSLANRLRREASSGATGPGVDATSATTTPAAVARPVASPVSFTPLVTPPTAVTESTAPSASVATPVAPPVLPPPPPESPPPRQSVHVRRHRSPTPIVATVLGAAAVAAALFAVRSGGVVGAGETPRAAPAASPASSSPPPVVAVGHIAGYELGARAGELTSPLSDLLATNLARVPGLRVISVGRMLELVGRAGAAADTSAGALTAAARAAGATELVDGTLYGRPDGRLRLDLRRVDLATGSIVGVHTVEGADLFVLVDSGTARLASQLGGTAPTGSVADVTTRSLAAYRLYAEGLRRYYALQPGEAERLLSAAVAEDSTFAMALYYWALVTPDLATSGARMARAVRLSSAASDRERLLIRAGAALKFSSPELAAIADTLVTSYPDEVYGHLYRGAALVEAQEYLAAVPHLRRAMQMDSVAMLGARAGAPTRGSCPGCEARSHLVFAYAAADSMRAAEREARAWTRWVPGSPAAWLAYGSILDAQGRFAEGQAAIDSARAAGGALGGTIAEAQNSLALHLLHAGEYARSEELLRARAASGTLDDQVEAAWYLTILYREQGRLADALAAARRYRVLSMQSLRSVQRGQPAAEARGSAPGPALLEAVVLDDMGRHREAAALFDSVSRMQVRGVAPSHLARNRVWMMTQAAGALAVAGDTAGMMARADTVAAYGAQSGLGRDRRLFHYVRGLALAARGDDAAAVEELRAANRSATLGYTRANAELARALLRLRRPAEAVRVLQPTLRIGIDGSNLYVSRTVLHEILAQAWDSAGGRDSAAVHYAVVARLWGAGDPPYRARAAAAAARSAALGSRRG